MSYKDGIPLLSTFEDDADEDGYGVNSEVERRRFKCARGHICFGVVLAFAAVLVIALAISVTLGFVLKKSKNTHPDASGHVLGPTTVGNVGWSSVLPSESGATSASAAATPVYSSATQLESTGVPQLESSFSLGPVSGTGTVPVVSTSAGMVPVPSGTTVATISSGAAATPSSVAAQPTQQASSIVSLSAMPIPSSTLSSQFPSTTTVLPSVSSSQAMPSSSLLPLLSSSSSSSFSSSVAMPTATPTTPPPPPPSCVNNAVMCPSPNDNRVYKFMQLPENDLRVVLISDPETDMSGAAMNVNAGSFNDPANYTGLAHFCEHMLFLGTGKYPDKNEYSNFLSTHGGNDNAYTSAQETNYFFNIQAEHLVRALDMFAHFFIDPLFDAMYVQSELNAVNQEHQKNLLNDDWRQWQLLKHVTNPGHPFHQFATGDFETLNKTDVRDQLMQYYHARYSASTMNLVVYGRENISALLDMVTNSFSDVPNSHAQPLTYPFPLPFSGYNGRMVVYQPQASTSTLTLYWQVNSLHEYPTRSLDTFIVRYLGHEGNGSIFKHLQRQNFASAVAAGVDVAADSFYLFKLQVTLTEEGLGSVGQVVKNVFEFLNSFRNLSKVEYEQKWMDFIEVSEVAFDYKEKSSASDYSEDISSTMRVNSNPADFLPNPRRFVPDYELLQQNLKKFTPFNSLMFLATQSANVSDDLSLREDFGSVDSVPLPPDNSHALPIPELDLMEPIYSTPFTIYTLPYDLAQYFYSPNDSNPDLYPANSNMFLPNRAHLTPVSPTNQTAPMSTSSNHSVQTWVLPDTQSFDEPKVSVRCELKTGKAMETPQWFTMAEVYLDMVRKVMGPTVFSAMEVGYTLQLNVNPRGVVLRFGGLTDDDIILQLLSITTLTLMNSGGVLNDQMTFDLSMSDITNTLRDFNFTNLPFRYTYNYIQRVLLERPTWTNEVQLQVLGDLDLASVLLFGSSKLISDLNIICLVHGSTSNDRADSYVSVLTNLLSSRISSSSSYRFESYPTTRVQLESGGDYGLSIPTLNPVDSNSVINIVFQSGDVCVAGSDGNCNETSLLRGVYLSLLELIIADECFTQLRTTELLGYVVFCRSFVKENIGSFQVIVQSEEFTPNHVLSSIESFLEDFYNSTVMSPDFESNFSDIVNILRHSLSDKDLTLSDKTDRVWPEVLSGKLQFDLKQQQLDALDGLLVEAFQDFYSKLILDSNFWKKLTILVYGEDEATEVDADCEIRYDLIDQTQPDLKHSCA